MGVFYTDKTLIPQRRQEKRTGTGEVSVKTTVPYKTESFFSRDMVVSDLSRSETCLIKVSCT